MSEETQQKQEKEKKDVVTKHKMLDEHVSGQKCLEVDSELKYHVIGSRRVIANRPGNPEWMTSARFFELYEVASSDRNTPPPGLSSSWVAVKSRSSNSSSSGSSSAGTVTAGAYSMARTKNKQDKSKGPEVFMRNDQLPPFLFAARTDDLICEEAHRLASLLEDLPGLVRDNSTRGNMLIDIIDPNAFPLDTTTTTPSSALKQVREDSSIQRPRVNNNATPLRYRWLPSEVSVRDNRAFFASEISGLQDFDLLRDSDLIPLLELSLTRMLPMFETVLEQSFLPNSDLQVIVKCQSYHLPGQMSYSGEFHREGPPEEHIRAVGLLYLNIDPRLEGGALDFKLIVEGGCVGTSVRDVSVNTHSGLSLVFRNDKVFHRMSTLTNPSSEGSLPASRMVLGFFLIDPAVRAPSTAQYSTQKEISQFLSPPLLSVFHGILPLVALVRSYAGLIMTDEQAEIREKIITERRRPEQSPESFIRGGKMD